MQSLHPRAVWLFFITFSLRSLAVLAFTLILGLGTLKQAPFFVQIFIYRNFSFILLAVLVACLGIFVLCFLWAILTYRSYRYELADDGFHKKSGVIYKRSITVPYKQIQEADIRHGTIGRMLRLSELRLRVVGQERQEVSVSLLQHMSLLIGTIVHGLSQETAAALYRELKKRIGHPIGKTQPDFLIPSTKLW